MKNLIRKWIVSLQFFLIVFGAKCQKLDTIYNKNTGNYVVGGINNNLRNGEWIEYSSDHKETRKMQYLNGICIKEYKYYSILSKYVITFYYSPDFHSATEIDYNVYGQISEIHNYYNNTGFDSLYYKENKVYQYSYSMGEGEIYNYVVQKIGITYSSIVKGLIIKKIYSSQSDVPYLIEYYDKDKYLFLTNQTGELIDGNKKKYTKIMALLQSNDIPKKYSSGK
jgi:hypothetical protein